MAATVKYNDRERQHVMLTLKPQSRIQQCAGTFQRQRNDQRADAGPSGIAAGSASPAAWDSLDSCASVTVGATKANNKAKLASTTSHPRPARALIICSVMQRAPRGISNRLVMLSQFQSRADGAAELKRGRRPG